MHLAFLYRLQQCLSASLHGGNRKIIFISRKPLSMKTFKDQKIKRPLVAHEDCSSTVNCWTKNSRYISRYIGNFTRCLKVVMYVLAEALMMFEKSWMGNNGLNGHLLQTQTSRVTKTMSQNFYHKLRKCNMTTDIKAIEKQCDELHPLCMSQNIFHEDMSNEYIFRCECFYNFEEP
jgi:hypothetical protein